MSLNHFFFYLQQLLTMVDPKNRYSVALAETALRATVDMAQISEKTDYLTYRIMSVAKHQFHYLVDHCEEYAGVPGEYQENEKKRRRLRMMLQPGC